MAKGSKSAKPVIYDGVSYPSILRCCEKLGINHNTVSSRAYKYGLTIEESIEASLSGGFRVKGVPRPKRTINEPISQTSQSREVAVIEQPKKYRKYKRERYAIRKRQVYSNNWFGITVRGDVLDAALKLRKKVLGF